MRLSGSWQFLYDILQKLQIHRYILLEVLRKCTLFTGCTDNKIYIELLGQLHKLADDLLDISVEAAMVRKLSR